jgi:hypothetical protein
MIPREGGSKFSGIVFTQGANGPLASDNRSDRVKAFIPEPLGLAHTYEFNPRSAGRSNATSCGSTSPTSCGSEDYVTLPDRTQVRNAGRTTAA